MAACMSDDECGAHASCQVDLAGNGSSTCACEAQWSRSADFLVLNRECVLSEIGIAVLWAANLIFIAYVLYDCGYFVAARIEHFMILKKTRKNYGIWENKGLIAVLLYFGISLPAHVVMCIAHFVNPSYQIGLDLLPTCCFFIAKVGFYSMVVFLQGPFLASALQGQTSQAHLVRYNYVANTLSALTSIALGALPFILFDPTVRTDFDSQLTILRVYYFMQAFSMLINAVVANFIKRSVFRVLDGAKSTLVIKDKTAHIREAVAGVQENSFRQAVLQGVVYVIMGSVPFLLNKHAYFLPISWLAFPALGRHLAKQINADTKGAKSLRQRLKINRTGDSTGQGSSHGLKPDGSGLSSIRSPNSKTMSKLLSEGNQDSIGHSIASFENAESFQFQNDMFRRGPEDAENNRSSAHSSTADQSFADLITKDSAHRQRFVEFVRGKYATEELALFDSATEFHKLGKAEKPNKRKLNNLGKKICAIHLVANAPLAVDIPDGIRRRLLLAYEAGEFDPKAFDVVRTLAFQDLKDNFYFQFLNAARE